MSEMVIFPQTTLGSLWLIWLVSTDIKHLSLKAYSRPNTAECLVKNTDTCFLYSISN